MTIVTKLVLTYPDRETALLVAQALVRAAQTADMQEAGLTQEEIDAAIAEMEPVTEFPPDGYLNGVYYNINELGLVYTPATFDAEGNVISGHEVVLGWHLLGAWQGPQETVPLTVWAAHVADRPDWWPRMG